VYEKSALILDVGDSHLAQLSLALIELGHRPLYATDLDELVLLARERKDQVSAVVLSAARAVALWPEVRRRVVEPLGLAPACTLLVGKRLDVEDTVALHDDGLRWALWESFSFADLRFAVSHALAVADPDDFRVESRVPCSFPVDVVAHDEVAPARLTDISTGGSFVELARPVREGASILLRGQLAGRLVSIRARVAWRTGDRPPKWQKPGMGIEFEELGMQTLALLRRLVEGALDRFRLSPAAQTHADAESSD
jgi:hypothetical protein